MRPRHILLALLTVTIWGFNFVVIKIGLQGMPPLFFTTLRFTFAALPLVFFVARPTVPWPLLVGWGLAQFAVQFGLLFVGMKLGMSAGLSSLVIQLQAFFTIGLAWWLLGEHARFTQLFGAGIALLGMGVVAWHLDTPASLIGLLLVVGAGCSWAVANVLTKHMKVVNPMSLVVWGSLVAVPPLLAMSALVEGPQNHVGGPAGDEHHVMAHGVVPVLSQHPAGLRHLVDVDATLPGVAGRTVCLAGAGGGHGVGHVGAARGHGAVEDRRRHAGTRGPGIQSVCGALARLDGAHEGARLRHALRTFGAFEPTREYRRRAWGLVLGRLSGRSQRPVRWM
jgi:Permeases of the drug/metabolite transporter (DMT) superfamily